MGIVPRLGTAQAGTAMRFRHGAGALERSRQSPHVSIHIRGVGKLLRDNVQLAVARYDLCLRHHEEAPEFDHGRLWIEIGTPLLITGLVPVYLVLSDGCQSVPVLLQEPAFEISYIRYLLYPVKPLSFHRPAAPA